MAWRTNLGQSAATLHLDVHGCRDPPSTASHLTVGLGAMTIKAESSGVPKRVVRVEAFSKYLSQALTPVLMSLRLRPRVQEVMRVMVPTAKNTHMRFAGAWAADARRHTQTQQAVAFAGFEYSVQLEMSKTLRRALLQDRATLEEFAMALSHAWGRATHCP